MKSYIIEGGKKLNGEVTISGSKNASLPILAGTILSGKETVLYNVPNIYDTKVTLDILRKLGCKVKKFKNRLEINSKNMTEIEIPELLMKEIRSTVILAGAILSRFKKVKFSYPGGCEIGTRPIDLHLKGFEKLGVNILENTGYIICSCDKIVGADINLDFPSVGATENIILAAIFAEGTTIINNAAMEPEIENLQNFLNKMGAKVSGAGTSTIKIIGVTTLKNTIFTIMPDRIEAGTFLAIAAITNSNIKIKKVIPEHLSAVISKLEDMDCKIEIIKDSINIIGNKKLKAVEIKTLPYPGFPTDLQSIFGTVLTVAKGTSLIIENIFENRFRYISELIKMGAKIKIEGRIAIIKGIKKLKSADINSTDLRGGAALVVAALNAKGKSKVNNIEYIFRGYENFDEKLKKLGADIKLIN